MIEFNIGGILLDVPSNMRLQFVKKNILFAFDSIECERTTSFRLPKTPTNLRAFDFSNDFHRQGNAMRVRVDAQLRIGVVVKNGYLYVQTYDNKSQEFDCIFVTGELIGLKQLKELGKANEKTFDINDSAEYNVLTSLDVLLQYDPKLRVLQSYSDDKVFRPSYDLGYILDLLIGLTDITVDTLPSKFDVLMTEPNQLQPTTFSITQQVIDSSQPTEYPSANYYNTISASENVGGVFEEIGYDEYNGEPTIIFGLQRYYRAKFLRPKMDIKITFPTDFPNVFMYGMRSIYGSMVFYGGYSFSVSNYQIDVYGESLAGRTVSLKKGEAFIFVDVDDYQASIGSGSGMSNDGFYPLISQTNFEGMTVEADGELQTGDIIYLRDNIPSLTAVDILKIYAYINGKVLWYDSDNQRVTFEDLIVSDYPVYTLKNAINVTNVKRSFGDYAQKNILRYESPDFMRSSDIMEQQYTIDNVNIEQEKELYRIPFSEGRRYNETSTLLIRATDNDTIANPKIPMRRLFRTELVKNNVLQSVLTNSTTIEVQCKMSLFEFNRIRDKLRIFYDNAYWVWLDISWDDGVADITLARV